MKAFSGMQPVTGGNPTLAAKGLKHLHTYKKLTTLNRKPLQPVTRSGRPTPLQN